MTPLSLYDCVTKGEVLDEDESDDAAVAAALERVPLPRLVQELYRRAGVTTHEFHLGALAFHSLERIEELYARRDDVRRTAEIAQTRIGRERVLVWSYDSVDDLVSSHESGMSDVSAAADVERVCSVEDFIAEHARAARAQEAENELRYREKLVHGVYVSSPDLCPHSSSDDDYPPLD